MCLKSHLCRIKDVSGLWSEESFVGERGKMEKGIWISVRLQLMNSFTHPWRKGKKHQICLFFTFREKKKERRKPESPFARMYPNQACNYNLEHAVKRSSSKQFEWKQCTLFPAHRAPQLNANHSNSTLTFFPFQTFVGTKRRLGWCDVSPFLQVFERFPDCSSQHFKSPGLESEWEED